MTGAVAPRTLSESSASGRVILMSVRKLRPALLAAMAVVLVAGAAGCTQTAGHVSGAASPSSPATQRAAAAVLAKPAAGSAAAAPDHGHHHRAGLLLRVRPLLRRAGAR